MTDPYDPRLPPPYDQQELDPQDKETEIMSWSLFGYVVAIVTVVIGVVYFWPV